MREFEFDLQSEAILRQLRRHEMAWRASSSMLADTELGLEGLGKPH